MARDILTDERWEQIRPLLPPHKPKTGRPNKDHSHHRQRHTSDRSNHRAPWRDLAPEYAPWRSVATRFYRWVRVGVWERVLREIQRRADAEGEVDWGDSITSTGVWFEPISTLEVLEKGGLRCRGDCRDGARFGGFRTQPGQVHDQDTPACRRGRQAHSHPAHRRRSADKRAQSAFLAP